MRSSAKLVAFVPSTDLDRSRRFYEDVLEMTVVHADDFAVVVDSGGVTVRITNVGPELRAQPFTVLGWQVDDIRGEIAGLVSRGVEFLRFDGMDQDEEGIWTTPDAAQIAWFEDPDGNTLSLTQHT